MSDAKTIPAAADVLRHSRAIFDLQAERDREVAAVRAKYARRIAEEAAAFAERFGFAHDAEAAEAAPEAGPAPRAPVQRVPELRNEDLLATLRAHGPCGLQTLALSTMGRDDNDLRRVISSRMFTLVRQGRAVRLHRGVWGPVEVTP